MHTWGTNQATSLTLYYGLRGISPFTIGNRFLLAPLSVG